MGAAEGGTAVHDWIQTVTPDRRRADTQRLDEIFREDSGFEPWLWSGSMVGYGCYDYRYKSGYEGRSLATGFSARKANMVLYIMPGYTDFSAILQDLGPHKRGKSCLYFQRLDALHEPSLRRLIRAGLDGLAQLWPVQPGPG
jgi:hypothetical protein